jgi:hypothetical protein
MELCFVIMPITTPEALVPLYGKDTDHFSHVLEHLFVPAIKKANFAPIPPIAQGADVIHAEIIKNLETADIVLCDISSLNPNVFFELGCRTALNRPVCYVMDDLTRHIPFDTGIINHHTYSHTLAPWTLESEVERLSAHLRTSADRSAGKSMLWQYFGLQSAAHAAKSQGEEEDRLAYLTMQVDAIKQRLDQQPNVSPTLQFTTPTYGIDTKTLNAALIGETITGSWVPPDLTGPIKYFLQDWDKEIESSENDLQQITLLQKQNERPPDIDTVRPIIEQHIKSLGELIDSEARTARADKARLLQLRYRGLLSR